MRIPTKTITYYELCRGGSCVRYGLDRNELLLLNKGRRKIRQYQLMERVGVAGVINGELLDWDKDCAGSFKVHIECPECGWKMWEDFVSKDAGRDVLWFGTCDCVRLWVVTYPTPTEKQEHRINSIRDLIRPATTDEPGR